MCVSVAKTTKRRQMSFLDKDPSYMNYMREVLGLPDSATAEEVHEAFLPHRKKSLGLPQSATLDEVEKAELSKLKADYDLPEDATGGDIFKAFYRSLFPSRK